MEPTLITDRGEIEGFQTRLEEELKQRSDECFQSHYSTRGLPQGKTLDAYYFKDLGIYYRPPSNPSKWNRYINCFGQGKATKRYRDAFQLNFPISGVNRSTKGGFLKSGSSVCVLHRGPLGGGRKDGRHNLCDYASDLVGCFDDDGRKSNGVVIPFLGDAGRFEPNFLLDVKRIVDTLVDSLGRVD